ncbi:MAG TPA: MmgE/PrpD family protein [Bordetella sp.]
MSQQIPSPLQARLAEFIVATPYAALPDKFLARLKWSLLDSLGCGLYGSRTEWAGIVARHAVEQGSGPARLWGSPLRVAASSAVLANATMIHSFEIDDVHYGSRSHPGSVTIPVALALIDQGLRVSGQALLCALAVGYEMLARVGACQGVSSFNRGWHPTGTAGVFAATATAARLMGLTQAQCLQALGIAGAMPAGLMAAQYGAMVKRFYAGHAAWVGLTAASLARQGFTGMEDVFDAEYGGYPKALSDAVSLDALTDGLGARYDAGTIGYKFFSCVGTNHTALEAVSELMREHGIAWREVREVRVATSEYQVLHSGWEYKPSTVMAAQMNMQYCIAALLMQGAVFVDQFEERLLADPEVLALAKRVVVNTDAAQDHKDRTAKVEIELAGGRVLAASCSAARGHPDNPPTYEDIERKFLLLAGKIVSPDQCRALSALVGGIESQDDLSGMGALMAAAAGVPKAS